MQTAHRDDTVECHVHGPLLCAGIAICRANVAKRLRNPEVPKLLADRTMVFDSPKQFISHHRSGVVSSEIEELKHDRTDIDGGRE